MNVILRDDEKIQVKCAGDLFEVMRNILDREEEIDKDREHFWVVGLNAGNWILFVELISLGTVKATVVDPMDVFSFALQKRAVKVIMVHNHPSTDLTPSENDKDLTDRMIQVGKIVDTPVLDHLVISLETYTSFLDDELMAELEKSTKWEPPYVTKERIRKQAEEIGKKIGRREGIKIGKKRGIEIGKEEGRKLGKQEGLEEGLDLGELRGIEKGRLLIAAQLKRKGFDRDLILDITGVPEEELDSL
jgi:DNA repair protein RadC